MAIQFSYSSDYPVIQRIQGGILYPHGIEQVKTEDGESQYRFRYIKIPDSGQDIKDAQKFVELHADQIAEYLKQGVDLQALTAKHPFWVARAERSEVEVVKASMVAIFPRVAVDR